MRTATLWIWLIACALVAGLATPAAGQLGPEWVDSQEGEFMYTGGPVVVGNGGDVFTIVRTYSYQVVCRRTWCCNPWTDEPICDLFGCERSPEPGIHRIVKYSPGGDASFINLGSGDKWPLLAVDQHDNVYVTANGITKISPNGGVIWHNASASEGTGLAVDSAGNVYVTGVGMDDDSTYATVKYSPDGDTLWVRQYDPRRYSRPIDLAVDGAGNAYVTGNVRLLGGSGTDYATIKYSPDGDAIWIRGYNGPGNSWDEAQALAVDDSGNVHVTGSSYGTNGDRDYATIKYSPVGVEAWVARYNGPDNQSDLPYAVAVDASGNVVVTGNSGTIKYSSAGETLWIRHPDLEPWWRTMATDADGNVYLGGRDYFVAYAMKYSPTGDTLWIRRNTGHGAVSPFFLDVGCGEWSYGSFDGLALDSDDNAYFVGTFYCEPSFDYGAYGVPPCELFSPLQTLIAKYSDPVGDVNCDGGVDLVDVALLRNFLDGQVDLTGTCGGGQSDVDLDGDVDENDYALLLLYLNLDHDEDGIANGVDNCPAIYNPEQGTTVSLPGDANQDDVITSADIIHDVNYVFKGGGTPLPCEASGDVTCDGVVNPSDVITLVNHVFKSGSPPCEVCEEYGLGWTCP